jgi:hypothetical protein
MVLLLALLNAERNGVVLGLIGEEMKTKFLISLFQYVKFIWKKTVLYLMLVFELSQ